MTKKIVTLLSLVCILSITSLTCCSFTEGEADSIGADTPQSMQQKSNNNDFDNPDYSNEEDGAEIVTTKKDEASFVGSWHAPSDKAEYLYGNVNLTIKEDHNWIGNITGESFTGHWQSSDSGIIMKSSDGIINWSLYYTTDGMLMFSDIEVPEKTLVLKAGYK